MEMYVSSSSDNDGPVAPPSPWAMTPLPSALAGTEMHERRQMWETTMSVPDSTRVTRTVAAQAAPAAADRSTATVPETAWTSLVIAA